MSSKRPNPALLTGNDALIKVNGITAGYGKNLQVNINNNVQPIQAIGFRKPRGLKSLNWSGTASMEFHILVVPEEGVVRVNTVDDDEADTLYDILVVHKRTGARIGKLVGAVNTEGFSLSNNDFTGRNVEFALIDWQPMEGFN